MLTKDEEKIIRNNYYFGYSISDCSKILKKDKKEIIKFVKSLYFKRCSGKYSCKKLKHKTKFGRNKKSFDNLQYLCTECFSKYNKKYKQANKDDILKYSSKYNKTHSKLLNKIIRKNQKLLSKYDIYNDKISYVEETRQDPNDKKLLQVKCTYCGKWYNPLNIEIQNRIGSLLGRRDGESRLYCSKVCKNECPTYNQKLYSRDYNLAPSREVNPQFRQFILAIDNYVCQRCGQDKKINSEVNLHCHHINPRASNPIEESDPDNGITLCQKCHIKTHQTISGCGYQEICNRGK